MLSNMRQMQEDRQAARSSELEMSCKIKEMETRHLAAESTWASEQIRLQAEMSDRVEAVMSMAAASGADSTDIDEVTRLRRRVVELEHSRAQPSFYRSPTTPSGNGISGAHSSSPRSLQVECERLEAESRAVGTELTTQRARFEQQRNSNADLRSENNQLQSKLRRLELEHRLTMEELRELRAEHSELQIASEAYSSRVETDAYSSRLLTNFSTNNDSNSFDNVRSRAVAVQQQVEDLEAEMRELVIASPLTLTSNDQSPKDMYNDLHKLTAQDAEEKTAFFSAPVPALFDLSAFCATHQLEPFETGLRALGAVSLPFLQNTSLAQLNELGLNTMEKLRFRRGTRF